MSQAARKQSWNFCSSSPQAAEDLPPTHAPQFGMVTAEPPLLTVTRGAHLAAAAPSAVRAQVLQEAWTPSRAVTMSLMVVLPVIAAMSAAEQAPGVGSVPTL